MITTTEQSRSKISKGFTLVEIMISMGLLIIIITAGLTAVTQIGLSSTSLTKYTEMTRDARNAVSKLASDLRLTYEIEDASPYNIDVKIYGAGRKSIKVSYTYDEQKDELYRVKDGTSETILTDLKSFNFEFYNLRGVETTKSISIKEVKVSGTMKKKFLTIKNTNKVVSAKFMLRNHSVSD